MLLALLPGLADAAVARPTTPRPLKDVLRERAEWLTLLNTVTKNALSLIRPHTGDGMELQLQFIAHACGSLLGQGASDDPDGPRIRPTPTNAAPWLIARWRAIAGDDPETTALPPPPTSTTSRNPLLPVIERLIRSAALEPLSAVRLRATILDPAPSRRAMIAQCLETTRPREAALARVLMALRECDEAIEPGAKIKAAKDAHRLAERDLGKLSPPKNEAEEKIDYLIHHDPLAYALAFLVEKRTNDILGVTGLSTDIDEHALDLTGAFKDLAAPFAPLLGKNSLSLTGSHTSEGDPTDLIWQNSDDILPPAQALAVALAMQEVAGQKPDWSILHRLTCYSLPLELLEQPTAPQSVQDSGTAPIPAVP